MWVCMCRTGYIPLSMTFVTACFCYQFPIIRFLRSCSPFLAVSILFTYSSRSLFPSFPRYTESFQDEQHHQCVCVCSISRTNNTNIELFIWELECEAEQSSNEKIESRAHWVCSLCRLRTAVKICSECFFIYFNFLRPKSVCVCVENEFSSAVRPNFPIFFTNRKKRYFAENEWVEWARMGDKVYEKRSVSVSSVHTPLCCVLWNRKYTDRK